MKTCIEVFNGMTYSQLFPLAKKAGFDGFFSKGRFANDTDSLEEFAELSRLHGLEWETSHSTMKSCKTIWCEGNEGDDYCKILLSNIDNCKRFAIPLLVVHASIDFSKVSDFEIGIRRLEPVVEYAKQKGVKIAFENTNSEEYLVNTLEHFDQSHVGFCYDSGHENIYPPHVRFLARFGDRLFCTHLNDNDGSGDYHQLPFDGTVDFEKISQYLKDCNYRGNLTMELSYNDNYKEKYTEEEYVKEAYLRIECLRNMIESK